MKDIFDVGMLYQHQGRAAGVLYSACWLSLTNTSWEYALDSTDILNWQVGLPSIVLSRMHTIQAHIIRLKAI